MIIGYQNFIHPSEVDLLVTPPSSVRYEPQFQPEQVLTASGLTELRGYNTRDDYAMRLEWGDLPEDELTRLAFIPPTEIVTLIDERGREQRVVFNEPVRSLKAGTTLDGRSIYSASMTAFPVSQAAFEENRHAPTPANVIVMQPSKAPVQLDRDAPAPPNPNPANYSPIHARASGRIPPGISIGEGVRFTFDTYSDDFGRGRYHSTDTDAYFELEEIRNQAYESWYSNINPATGTNVPAFLKRYPFETDSEFTIMALLWVPATGLGNILQYHGNSNLFELTYNNTHIHAVHHVGNVYQELSFPYQREQFIFLHVRNDHGRLEGSINGGTLVTATPTVMQAPQVQRIEEIMIGGSSIFLDDLMLVSTTDVDANQIYEWMLGE